MGDGFTHMYPRSRRAKTYQDGLDDMSKVKERREKEFEEHLAELKAYYFDRISELRKAMLLVLEGMKSTESLSWVLERDWARRKQLPKWKRSTSDA